MDDVVIGTDGLLFDFVRPHVKHERAVSGRISLKDFHHQSNHSIFGTYFVISVVLNDADSLFKCVAVSDVCLAGRRTIC